MSDPTPEDHVLASLTEAQYELSALQGEVRQAREELGELTELRILKDGVSELVTLVRELHARVCGGPSSP